MRFAAPHRIGHLAWAMMAPIHQSFPMLPGRAAQIWRHQPAYQRPRHFHAEPEINVVFRGWARMGVGRAQISMSPGDVIFLKPAQDHVMLEASEDLELFVMAAKPELAARFFTGAMPVATCALELPSDRRGAWFDELMHLGQVTDGASHERTVARLFEWALPRHPRGHVVARKGLERLLSDPSLSARDLAQSVGSGPAELSRHFAAELGVGFAEARARLRLVRFIQAVDRGLSLTAAAQLHFGSYAQCHRNFRKHVRCGPREYFKGAHSEIEAATLFLPASAGFDHGCYGDT